MNKRDVEDIKMQARENVKAVMDDVLKETSETDTKRAIGAFWAQLPEDVKVRMAQDKPEIVQQMNEMYQPQGNPWGEKKGR